MAERGDCQRCKMLLDHFDVRWIGNLHSANKLLKALSKLDDGYALCKRIIDRGPVCYAVDSDVIKNALESHWHIQRHAVQDAA
jgi:hypothetical protein